eukprot:g79934.t1
MAYLRKFLEERKLDTSGNKSVLKHRNFQGMHLATILPRLVNANSFLLAPGSSARPLDIATHRLIRSISSHEQDLLSLRNHGGQDNKSDDARDVLVPVDPWEGAPKQVDLARVRALRPEPVEKPLFIDTVRVLWDSRSNKWKTFEKDPIPHHVLSRTEWIGRRRKKWTMRINISKRPPPLVTKVAFERGSVDVDLEARVWVDPQRNVLGGLPTGWVALPDLVRFEKTDMRHRGGADTNPAS